MPITLRTRPTCHYCGKRNSPSTNQRTFTCQYCQAENYLDETGQITDVPAFASAPPKQYAVPVAPTFEPAGDSIFCSTCLKNQYMYNAALSEYLPDPDHPEYEKFEAAIPAFKQDLERRYPTCCVNCEPRVRAQLQQATYNARSDHVRRVLDRSRQRRNASRWGWRSLLVSTSGLGWFISISVQLVWHAFGSQAHSDVVTSSLTLAGCLRTWPVPIQCPNMMEWLIAPSLFLGMLCLWWNPKWQHKLEGREGKLVGLDKFYRVQAVLLALRFTSWTVIKDVPDLANFRPTIHATSMMLIAMVAGWSYVAIIRIDMPRIVDWSQNPAPLLDSKQYIPPALNQGISPPNSQGNVSMSVFNTATTQGPQPWNPPTPPVDEDAMEWDPTPVAFNPSLKKINYKSTEPSPFQGTLPAFPKGGIFSSRNDVLVEQPKSIGLPIGLFDKSHGRSLDNQGKAQSRNAGLAQPKFFPETIKADTGLENIFDTVFSLTDDAKLVGTTAAIPTISQKEFSEPSSAQSLHMKPEWLIVLRTIYDVISAVLLAAFAILFSAQSYLSLPRLPILSIRNMLYVSTTVQVVDIIVELLSRRIRPWNTFDYWKIISSAFESFGMFLLTVIQPETQSLMWQAWTKFVIFSLSFLFAQKIYFFWVDSASSQIPPHRVEVNEKEQSTTLLPATELMHEPIISGSNNVRRSSSDESLASTASIATTSTASGWKTPVRNHREELRGAASSTSYGLGGLSLKNDHEFGFGNSIAGPRTRRTPARNQRGW